MKQLLFKLLLFTVMVCQSVSSRAQVNITGGEYFFDNDPGFGNGVGITISSPSNNISSMLVNVNTSSLTNGVHTLYIRTIDANGKWSITNTFVFAKVQSLSGNPHSISNVDKIEYFYDNDPGFGNGTNVPITAASVINNLLINVDVSTLTFGVHTLYIRSRDVQGKWSVSNTMYFAKVQPLLGNPHNVSNINKMEYFYNTDPGFGNGVDIPVTAASNINGFIVNADVLSLPSGLHTLYIRSRDAQGKWSVTNTLNFTKIKALQPNPHTVHHINKMEYFYDVDPGFGNGTNIPVTPNTNINNLIVNTDVSMLPNGVHTLYIRSRDSAGQWSATNTLMFAKVIVLSGNPHTISNITQAEYFYNTDPGFGNGINIPSITGNSNFSNTNFNADVTTLPDGVHTLYIRTKDAQGKWALTNSLMFAKVKALSPNPHTQSTITHAEYFVDTDPGFGNAIHIPIASPSANVANLSFNVDMTFLANTSHHLYVRTKDAQGKWSITNVHAFNGGLIPLSMKLISFEATLIDNNKVSLDWITEQEKNVDRYVIEKSNDASHWVLLNETDPKGNNATTTQKYQLIDENPGKGIVYYRLTEHDLNGTKTIAPIRFVRIEAKDVATSSVFPNPNDGKKVNIQSDIFNDGEIEISIITTDGKLYLKQNVTTNGIAHFTLADLNLPAAMYFINLRSNSRTESIKLQVVGNK